MITRTLTQNLLKIALPRSKTFIIRDKKLKGLFLRVTPTGCRRFVLNATRNQIRQYETIGDADHMDIDEARNIARRKINALTITATPQPQHLTVTTNFIIHLK